MSTLSTGAFPNLPTDAMDDVMALRRYASKGDPTAFAALTQRYQGMVLATCRRVLRSQADAEDAAQETFLKLARNAGVIRGNAAAWLHACAMGTATDLLRRKGTRKRAEQAVMHASSQSAPASSSDDARLWSELEPMLDAALASLSDEERDAIVGHFLAGRPQKDLAREAGVSGGTMSRRVESALRSLALALRATNPAMIVGTGLAAALTLGGHTAQASPALGASLAKIGLLEAAVRGKAAGALTSGVGLKVLGAAAALIAMAGSVALLAARPGPPPTTPAVVATTTTATEPEVKYTGMARPTEASSGFMMSSERLAGDTINVFRITADATTLTMQSPADEAGKREEIIATRERDRDKVPARAGKQGEAGLRVTRYDASGQYSDGNPTGRTSTLRYRVEGGLLRGTIETEGLEHGENVVWRPMVDAKFPASAEDPVAGAWEQVPVWWRLRFKPDVVELCGGGEDFVVVRYRIMSWTEEKDLSRVEAMCVDNLTDKAMIGKRVRLLVRRGPDDLYQIAQWDPSTGRQNEWPHFDPKQGEKIRIATFSKEVRK